MGLNRYYGMMMYCSFIPFSIYATDEKEALTQLQTKTPEPLTEPEKKELSFRLTRVPHADKVTLIKQEASSERNENEPTITRKVNRVSQKIRRSGQVQKPISHKSGV